MLASYQWLTALAGFSVPPQELADRFTFGGLEVDSLVHRGPEFAHIVLAEVVSKEAHPRRENLHVVQVNDGTSSLQVVCGAGNCPGPGGRVVLAKVGATVGGIEIAPRELGGVASTGMLCSEAELSIGPEKDGIIVVDDAVTAPLGTPIAEALALEDWIFELGVTPNRPDALSHWGLAREMCLLYERPFVPEPVVPAPVDGIACGDAVSIVIDDAEGCPRYAAALVRGVTVGPSPFDLRYRLHCLGIRPISNLVDITNAVLLLTGQPLHAFDFAKLSAPQIEVRRARKGESIKTLDGETRALLETDLLICSDDVPVAIAGVMGGFDSEISDETRDVLIECAYFQPSSVRRTSKRLKLSSEASYRFERGVDPLGVPQVLDVAVPWVTSLAGGAAAPGVVDAMPAPIAPAAVPFRPSRFATIMGHALPEAEMQRILQGLGATIAVQADDAWVVHVPTTRPDIGREIDLIEELARVHGLDKVPASLPRLQSITPQRREFDLIRRAKEVLLSCGLDESISYSFVPASLLKALHHNAQVVRIANPLNAERDAMRTTLLGGLLENLKRAQSRYMHRFAQFEVGRSFHVNEAAELPDEIVRVAGVLFGHRPGWPGEQGDAYDFSDIRGVVEVLSERMTGAVVQLAPTSEAPWLHPGRACEVRIQGVRVGFAGEVHPECLASLKMPRGALCFELDLLALAAHEATPRALPLSDYPPMTRDVAFLADNDLDAMPIAEALQQNAGPLAVSVHLFDVYAGQGVANDKKSLAFSVQYRAMDRTLTDAEVDAAHQQAVATVSAQFSLSIR
ncbi:MAG: phenylalanine--tRNA ligase subunit beta [Proteobacteria bacterium]|nr:phenylalanine--tRNA ligase subunit beta [Pseudomonadota bacterium]